MFGGESGRLIGYGCDGVAGGDTRFPFGGSEEVANFAEHGAGFRGVGCDQFPDLFGGHSPDGGVGAVIKEREEPIESGCAGRRSHGELDET